MQKIVRVTGSKIPNFECNKTQKLSPRLLKTRGKEKSKNQAFQKLTKIWRQTGRLSQHAKTTHRNNNIKQPQIS